MKKLAKENGPSGVEKANHNRGIGWLGSKSNQPKEKVYVGKRECPMPADQLRTIMEGKNSRSKLEPSQPIIPPKEPGKDSENDYYSAESQIQTDDPKPNAQPEDKTNALPSIKEEQENKQHLTLAPNS